jgi:hypothetical protein
MEFERRGKTKGDLTLLFVMLIEDKSPEIEHICGKDEFSFDHGDLQVSYRQEPLLSGAAERDQM